MPMSDADTFRRSLETERPYLLRYARLQLRNPAAAEDAVQDTLVAALAGQAAFAGRSAIRTWLTGILKHKIIDSIRRSSREVAAGAGDPDGENLADPDAAFVEDGHWRDLSSSWGIPDRTLLQKEFFRVLEECLARLPEKTARVFMMREHLDMDTDAICKELGITPTNCWVMLYRARMTLRLCLQQNWFGELSKE